MYETQIMKMLIYMLKDEGQMISYGTSRNLLNKRISLH